MNRQLSTSSAAGTRYCANCGWAVQEGPEGGYVCGQCSHTVEPDPEPGPGEE